MAQEARENYWANQEGKDEAKEPLQGLGSLTKMFQDLLMSSLPPR